MFLLIGLGSRPVPTASGRSNNFKRETLNQKVLGEVKGFDPLEHFDDRQLNILDRVSQIAVVAAREAIKQSGQSFDGELADKTATIIGTGVGGQTTHRRQLPAALRG